MTNTSTTTTNTAQNNNKNMLKVVRLSWNPYQFEGRCHDLYLCCFVVVVGKNPQSLLSHIKESQSSCFIYKLLPT